MFFGGKPKELLEQLVSHRFEAYASTEIIEEYKDTISELCARYGSKPKRIPLAEIVASMTIIKTASHISVCRDPDDNKFIECAYDAKCLYIVSGDRDLLSVGKYKNVEIVTVAEFLSDLLQ